MNWKDKMADKYIPGMSPRFVDYQWVSQNGRLGHIHRKRIAGMLLNQNGALAGTKCGLKPLMDVETIAGAPERVRVPRFFVVRTGHTDGHQMFGLASRATGKVYGQTLTRAEALRYQAVSRG